MPERTPRTKSEKKAAVNTVMHEFKHHTLHSGSKSGPKVKSRDQAIAIAMSESGQSKKGYDRSSHHPGNPGFPGIKEAAVFSNRAMPSNAHGFNVKGQSRQGHLRVSGHSSAHQIGKRR